MLLVRGFADGYILESKQPAETRDESFFVARVSSPLTALLITAITFAFTYIWTESAMNSFFVAVLFALPYFFIFIRFNKISFIKTGRIQRNILLESAVIAAVTFVVFRQISMKPLLSDQRANLLLLLAGIAPVIHAIYSAIYSSNEDKFSFDENTEIIKP
jgi:tetrahydromethanopterin S-methyltransferase subunit E